MGPRQRRCSGPCDPRTDHSQLYVAARNLITRPKCDKRSVGAHNLITFYGSSMPPGATKLGSAKRWAVETEEIRQQNEAAEVVANAGDVSGGRRGSRGSSAGLSADPAPHEKAAAHKYDPQVMLSFVKLCQANTAAVRAGLASASRHVEQLPTHDKDMDDFKDLVQALEEHRFNAIPIVSPTAEAWYNGAPVAKRKLFINAVLGLAANDWFDLEAFGLEKHAQEEFWYTAAEDKQPEPSPAGLPAQVVDKRDKRHQRRSLQKELPEKLSPANLEVCPVNFVMAAEILLNSTFDYSGLRDDQALLKAAKDTIALEFQTLSERSPINVNQHNQPDHFTDEELVQTMKALSPWYSKDHARSREAIEERIQHRMKLHQKTLQTCSLPGGLCPRTGESFTDWNRRLHSESSNEATKRQAPTDPFANALAKNRKIGPRGGRPRISLGEHVLTRHVRAGCGVSNYKAPLVGATTAVMWTGALPQEKYLISPSSTNGGMLMLHFADNLLDAVALNEVLVAKPYAAFSLFYDDTVSGTNKRGNTFIRGPFGQGASQASLQNKFISFGGSVGGAARTKAEATLQRLRTWAKPVEGLFLLILIHFVASVVDHAQLAEAAALIVLMNETLVFELAAAGKTLAEFGYAMLPHH